MPRLESPDSPAFWTSISSAIFHATMVAAVNGLGVAVLLDTETGAIGFRFTG